MSYLSDFLGGATLASESVSNVFKMPAMTALAGGDLAVHLENGQIIPYTADMGVSRSNNNTAGPVAVATRTIDGNQSGGSVFDVLSNGNIVGVRIQANDYKFIVTTPCGTVVVVETTVGTRANISQGAVAAFGDRFVVAVSDSGGNCFYAIYNNDGTLAAAEKTFASGANTLSLGALGLSANSFVIYYKEGGNPQPSYFRRFDATGTIQGGATLISAGCSSISGDGPFSDGSFIFTVQTNANTHRLAKFSAAGAAVFDVEASAGTGPNIRIAGRGCVVELNSGNLATTIGIPADTRARAIVIDKATGTTLYTVDPGATASNSKYGRVCSNVTQGGFAFITQNSATMWLNRVSESGTLLQQDGVLTVNNSATCYPLDAFELPGLGFVILAWGTNNSATHELSLKTLTYTAGTIGAMVNLVQGNGGWVGSYKSLLSGRMLFIESCPNSQYSVSSYNLYRSSIFGSVALTTAKGALATVKTSGYFHLANAAQVSSNGTTFDATANTVPGVKGKFVGRNVVLNGITA